MPRVLIADDQPAVIEALRLLLKGEGFEIKAVASPADVLEALSRQSFDAALIDLNYTRDTTSGQEGLDLHALSPRAAKPIVTVNAGALAEGTFESELFGHVRGAFTDAKTDRVGRFELADGGTLFLDEIANVPVNLQPKLLRVLETGEFERVGSSQTRRADVRLLSATNADLKEEVVAGRFRQDLFFRLNTVEIHLPPLRERREDIAALAEHFLRLYAQRYRKSLAAFEPAALEAMRVYAWPGNVRELDHVVQRAVLMSRGDEVKSVDLGPQPVREMGERRLEEMSLEDVERLLIQKALKRFGGNVSQAAEALGLSRSALYRRMQKYEI